MVDGVRFVLLLWMSPVLNLTCLFGVMEPN